MRSVALGTVVFQRTAKLAGLLESVPELVDTVYVADNGTITAERERLYDRPFPFDLEVLDLEYGSGLGHGRNEIVDRLREDYLLVVDNDMTVPGNVDVLAAQLDARPDLGGVCGVLIEDGNLHVGCCDLYEDGDLIVKDIRGSKASTELAGASFVPFDFITNAAMFRSDCLEEYSWDPAYVIGKEHLDFYVAHMHRTDWTFGVSPAVVFPHYPGGDSTYRNERRNVETLRRSKEYFLDKWGYRQFLPLQGKWVESFSDPRLRGWRFLAGYGARMALRRLPAPAQIAAMDARDRRKYG